MNKILYSVLGVLAAIAILGSYYFPQFNGNVGSSPTGSTFGDAKFAGVAINLANAGANGTSTSILNTDSNDRFVTESKLACENVGTSKTAYTGAGLANLQWSVGTTTTAAPGTLFYNALIVNAMTVATGTVNTLIASSTLQTASTTLAVVWPTNTYMTFYFNATNTAACTVGVSYFGS